MVFDSQIVKLVATRIADKKAGRDPYGESAFTQAQATPTIEDIALAEVALRAVAEARPVMAPALSQMDSIDQINDYYELEAVFELANERRRQIQVKGHTPETDANYVSGELARAAAAYALGSPDGRPPSVWPWGDSSWKSSNKMRNLIKAGALIMAEMCRIKRSQR